jgi:uncharacterized protein YeaO (DUF488 family)
VAAARRKRAQRSVGARKRPDIQIQRVYGAHPARGSFVVLVDRLWPRGVKKEKLALDSWARDIAPSTALRKWFGHEPERWSEFRKRYRVELKQRRTELKALRERAKQQPVVLLYAAKDARYNHAVVLQEVLRRR